MLGLFIASNTSTSKLLLLLLTLHRRGLQLEPFMHTEQVQRHRTPIHTATAVDRSNPKKPRRHIAQDIVAGRRRLRQRIGVVAVLCISLATLLVAFE
jgi:hypothetical protein